MLNQKRLHFSTLCNKVKKIVVVAALAFVITPVAQAQRMALKTNTLEYLILSPNLAFEVRVSRTLSVQLGVACNPINTPIGGVLASNFRVEPELRYWFNRPMARNFVALSLTGGTCNLRLNNRYWNGDAIAAGFSYGYDLVLSKHWNLEFEIGVGVAHMKGYAYAGPENMARTPNFSRAFLVPIRCGVSFSYIFK